MGLTKFFSQLNIYQEGNNAVIEISDSNKIILENIDHTQLTQDNFKGLLREGGYTINGSNGDDILERVYVEGALSQDSYNIYGKGGDDFIKDGYGDNDLLDGGEGNDALVTQYGASTLTGGTGSDKFIFSYFRDEYYGGNNIITDFDINDTNEKIILDATNIGDFSELVIVDGNAAAVFKYFETNSENIIQKPSNYLQ